MKTEHVIAVGMVAVAGVLVYKTVAKKSTATTGKQYIAPARLPAEPIFTEAGGYSPAFRADYSWLLGSAS